ncbi:MAG: ABC transporter permease [Candidatus Sumerlaeaceae bacterium]|nr:ABC transporter permease [Candidatus Sumerlaeaceae bacterium]
MIAGVLRYVMRTILRHRLRSALTLLGIATAMFLFCFVEGLQDGVRAATEGEAAKNRLIVYQKNRFCPATSVLPERYGDAIASIPGVRQVIPVKIFVNNCRASLDAVTFRGVPPETLASGEGAPRVIEGDGRAPLERFDAALIGHRLAKRRGLKVGDRLKVSNLEVGVAGIYESDIPGDDSMGYVGLRFLQQSRSGEAGLGRVTQFDVLIEDPSRTDEIIAAIDDRFRSDEVPTMTKTHKAHIASATGDLLGIIGFTRYLGILCVGLVLALTANTVYVMAHERVKEHAVLQTLGYPGPALFGIVVLESLVLSLGGGLLGTGLAALVLQFGHLSLGAEGVQMAFVLTPSVVVAGLTASLMTGIAAAFVPALQAALAPIPNSLRRA